MRVDHSTVALRPRDAWEAIDLGWLLVRRLGRFLWLPWLAACLPLWVLAAGAGVLVDPLAGLVLLWWLQPQGERVLLAILAEALFGAPPPVAASVQRIPRLVLGGLGLGLIGKRLDPTRAYIAPVAQLEGLRGRRRVRRESLLRSRDRGVAFLFSLLAVVLRGVLFVSALLLIALLLPAPLAPDWALHGAELVELRVAAPMRWLALVVAGAVLFAARPFQVAGGFALYINRRTALEGWDIEQAFRLLAERLAPAPSAPSASARATAAALPLALLLALAGAPPLGSGWAPRADPERAGPATTQPAGSVDPPRLSAGGQAPNPSGSEPDRIQEQLDEVLRSPDFGSTSRRLAFDWESDTPTERSELRFAGALAAVFRVLLWVLAAGLVGAAVRWLLGARSKRAQAAPDAHEAPARVVGLDLRPASLPDDVAAAAEELWRRGEQREALALLYRASLQRLIASRGLQLEAGDTEQDCLARVRELRAATQLSVPTESYFASLTAAWQRSAYARLEVAQEHGVELCASWREHFEGAA